MPTIVECPACGRKLRVSDQLLNRLVQCPSCSTRFTAEAGRTGAAESVQSAEAPPRAARVAANQGEGSGRAGPDYAEEDDDRPWEQPGQIRRDAVSHRGHLVLTLGILGVVLSVLGIPALFCGFCCPPVGIVGSL